MELSDLVRAIFSLFGRTPAAGPAPSVSPSSASSVTPKPATVTAAPTVVPVAPIPVTPAAPAAKPEVPVAAPDISTPAGFIAALTPAAKACAKRTGVPASVTVAQAALESSWGHRAPGMNLFGIKADPAWRGPVTSQVTHEVINGETITITARFRAYRDWEGSIDDHAAFLTGNPRYRPAFAFKDGPNFARAIAKAGYATDPLYADKLIAIMSTRGLGALDHPEA
ncbi:glycoside hydrolase family 73 protein [Burkholderia sp. Bp8995]|uniref:glycoside hydrolase family 73 protein n=1 Tax=Burkholderia sp. Bp8995 TaxID=2184556 RepID=UPI000F5A8BE6|nr:glucosaminidase domain-containing protein [Burkholderia sp. Bp8995]RQS22402.1 hypothetical protein DIE05_29685 [Burkholderia sp. Bp8995]